MINFDDNNENEIENEEDYITLTFNSKDINEPKDNQEKGSFEERVSRINDRKNKKGKKNKKPKKTKKKWSKKKKIIFWSIILGIILALGVVFGTYVYRAGGDVKEAVLNVATDIVGEQDPIFVLILGVSEDISTELTDTIMLCGYNPSTQKAYMVSIPRDTFVGKNAETASGYDKINALYQKSAEKTVEAVELLTGVTIDYYVIVRNISISSIFECIGEIEFDVPIDMDYDDPTQDLHIHLKKGLQTLDADQVEQLLRFRHNNDGTSYPSSYGDNDYGRMRTQREFLKALMNQMISVQNISKLKDVASMVYTNLQTNMSGYTVLDYVPYGLKFDTANLRSEQLPGQSALINELWFYNSSKSQTRALMDELMIYLELDDATLESHYKYASSIKGVKPDDNYVLNETIEDLVITSSTKKDTTETVSPENCDHQYGVYGEKEATCENGGTVTYKCIICYDEYTKSTSALGHNYVNGKCTRCNKEDPSYKNTDTSNKVENTTNNETVEQTPTTHTHQYTSQVTKSATCTETGTRTYTCSCGDSYTESIPATGHSYTSSDKTCPACGTANPNYTESETVEQPNPGEGDGSGEIAENPAT